MKQPIDPLNLENLINRNDRNRALREGLYHFLGVPEGWIGRFFVLIIAAIMGIILHICAYRFLEDRLEMVDEISSSGEFLVLVLTILGLLFGLIVGTIVWNHWLSKKITWKI